MLQIRHCLFETNSSSACVLSVMIAQIEGLEIPNKVQIDSSARPWDYNLSGCYVLADRNDQTDRFLGLLKHSGVKEIYVDGKLVEADEEVRDVKFLPVECVLAMCFGDYKVFSEWRGWGSEYEDSTFLRANEIFEIQAKLRDPNYIVICDDGEGNEINWNDLPYSKRVITEEEYKRALNIQAAEDPDYTDEEFDKALEMYSTEMEKYEGDEDADRLANKAHEQASKDQRYIRRNGYRDKKYKHL